MKRSTSLVLLTALYLTVMVSQNALAQRISFEEFQKYETQSETSNFVTTVRKAATVWIDESNEASAHSATSWGSSLADRNSKKHWRHLWKDHSQQRSVFTPSDSATDSGILIPHDRPVIDESINHFPAIDAQVSAVPIPGAFLLFGSGLIGFTAIARKRRK